MRQVHALVRSLAVFLLVATGSAQAAVFQFTLNVARVGAPASGPESCAPPPAPAYAFGCASPGDRFFGQFDIPDAALLTNGLKDNTGITNFTLNVGYVRYPDGGGFRNSSFHFAPEIGVLVIGGTVVALVGDVYSGGDQPYVDFVSPAINGGAFGDFIALDIPGEALSGTVGIARVPEPATILLLLAGLGVPGIASRRRAKLA